MKLDIVKVCATLVIILALFMGGSSMATETTWRFSGFELYGYDINFTSHNATNVKNLDAENITSKQIGNILYADQYDSIQDAIDNLSANRTYCETVKVNGNYTLSSALIIPSYTILDLSNSVLIAQASTSMNILQSESNATDITIIGGIIDGNKDNQVDGGTDISQNGMYLAYGLNYRITVRDSIIQNTYYNGMVISGFEFKIDNVKFYNNNMPTALNTAGLHISSMYGAKISDCIIGNDNGLGNRNGIFMYLSARNSISGCNIYNNSEIGIEFGYLADDNQIEGNWISANGDEGISLADGHGNTIIGNDITANYETGIYLESLSSHNNTIAGNTISNNGLKAADTYDGIRLYQSRYNIISNNNIYDDQATKTQRYGISEEYQCDYNIISNNHIHSCITDLRITGTSTTNFNNMCSGSSTHFGKRSTEPTPFGAGDEYYNSSNNIKYSYAGSNWKSLTNEYFYGEAHIYNNAVATVIETADTPIALRQITTGSLDGWTFDAGSTGAITAYADGGSGTVVISSDGHGLNTGDIITIRGTTDYNGVYEVGMSVLNAFAITATWVNDNGASDWDQGASLIAGANSAGIYNMAWQMSSAPAAAMTITWMAYINAVPQTKTTAERKYPINDKSCCASIGVLTISAGDVVWLSIQSDDTASVTNKHGNFNLHKIGCG